MINWDRKRANRALDAWWLLVQWGAIKPAEYTKAQCLRDLRGGYLWDLLAAPTAADRAEIRNAIKFNAVHGPIRVAR